MIKLKNLRAAESNQIYYFYKGTFEGMAITPIIIITKRKVIIYYMPIFMRYTYIIIHTT